jgi:hypothetical protein
MAIQIIRNEQKKMIKIWLSKFGSMFNLVTISKAILKFNTFMALFYCALLLELKKVM